MSTTAEKTAFQQRSGRPFTTGQSGNLTIKIVKFGDTDDQPTREA